MNNKIITIGRQFGSGGGDVSRIVSKNLGIKCYDKELIVRAAETSGISREALESVDERATNSFLYSLAMSSYSGQMATISNGDIVLSDRLFSVQSDVIRKVADESDCVIIGRCADDILSGRDGLLRVFIYAPLDFRISRICEQHNLNEANAKAMIKKTDKKRSTYYNFYTGKSWGALESYDICINSASIGIEKTAELIAEAARKK